MPPKKSTTAADKDKPKPKASKRAREEDTNDSKDADPSAAPPSAENANMPLINALEALMFYEFNFGDKFAALAHLGVTKLLRRKYLAKINEAKDLPLGNERDEYISRGHRQLIDEYLKDNKHTFDRLENLKAENPSAVVVVDEALEKKILENDVVGKPVDKTVLDKIAKEVPTYQAMTVENLKTLLRTNRQPVTGNKAELVKRVSEGVVLGAMQPCPQCFGGKLRYHVDTGIYTCHGFMDDDQYTYCYYKAADATRAPWQ